MYSLYLIIKSESDKIPWIFFMDILGVAIISFNNNFIWSNFDKKLIILFKNLFSSFFNFSKNLTIINFGKSFFCFSSLKILSNSSDNSLISFTHMIKSCISSSFNIVFSISIQPSLNILLTSSYFLDLTKYKVSGISFNLKKNSSNKISYWLFSLFSLCSKTLIFIPKLLLFISSIIWFIFFNDIFLSSKLFIELFSIFINCELSNKFFTFCEIILLVLSTGGGSCILLGRFWIGIFFVFSFDMTDSKSKKFQSFWRFFWVVSAFWYACFSFFFLSFGLK